MSAQGLILLMMLLSLGYSLVLTHYAELQRKKPLPPEVADVFDQDRYQKYLEYSADNRKLRWIASLVEIVLTAALLFSGLFAPLEKALGGNVYWIYLVTHVIFWAVETLSSAAMDYVRTFRIKEKYGMNKKDMREFVKDQVLGALQQLLLMGALGLIIAFIGEHMIQWTHGFTVGPGTSFLLCLAIAAVIGLFIVLGSFFSVWIMKKQYVFTPLEEGPLRDKIVALQKDFKKKVKIINVYNESKKSTSKNAFLLRLLRHREFGIADNFILENSENELLAVLSHEVGHLKHKKNLLNYLHYGLFALLFCAVALLIAFPGPALQVTDWVRRSFGLTVNNYYLLIEAVFAVLTPATRLIGILNNYRSRREEYEADREAVKNGYSEELIATFKRLSSDELVNVNPHPAIEFLEYDHPGMYHRIKAIREAQTAQKG